MKKFSVIAVIAILAGCFAFSSVACAEEIINQAYENAFVCGNACGKCKSKCNDGCKKSCDSCKPKCNSCNTCKPKCDTCKPKCDSCKPKCDSCKPKCDSCKPKCDSCKPKCEPCCKTKCCPKPVEDYPCPCTGDSAIGRPGMSRQNA